MYLVFSDLDGTLLDYDDHQWSPAGGGVHHLARHRIPLVFASSKTQQEQRRYQHEMEIRGPMIVESGSAVVLPVGYFEEEVVREVASGAGERTDEADAARSGEDEVDADRDDAHRDAGERDAGERDVVEVRSVADRIVLVLGCPVDDVRRAVREVREERGLPVRGFSELALADVRERTGLPEGTAARARSREFSETVVMDEGPEAWSELREALAERGLAFHGAGPMATVVDARTDKGRAARLVMRLYERDRDVEVTTVGIGDDHGDVPLLEVVDVPVLVERKGGGWIDADVPRLRRIEGVGPHGWERAVREVLDEPVKQSRPRASIWDE